MKKFEWDLTSIIFIISIICFLVLIFGAIKVVYESYLCKDHYLNIDKNSKYHAVKCYAKYDQFELMDFSLGRDIQCHCSGKKIISYNQNTQEIFYHYELKNFLLNPSEVIKNGNIEGELK